MLGALPITFDSPMLLAAALLLASVAVGLALARRAIAPASFVIPAGIGLMLVALAAGGPRGGNDRPRVVVMVDTSASTRGTAFRDEANVRADVERLIGDQPFSIIRFGDEIETRWTSPPPDTTAVILYSDGRFEPTTTAPPIYPVIYPHLEQPDDASVTLLERRGDHTIVTATNTGPGRELSVDGVPNPIGKETRTIALPATQASQTIARIASDDRWPENDALTLLQPPSPSAVRWWVGDGPPPGAWRAMSPGDLPADPAAWLAPSVIVFDNVDAGILPQPQASRLQQYVRDLGGGLLILGGDRAFAAGGYEGTALGQLSPLASNPPAPAAHWVFLLDASGSMAGELNGRTRLATAVDAARAAVAQLPPSDALSVAGFSDQMRWWSQGKVVKDGMPGDIPIPRGPTNLDTALRALGPSLDKSLANQIVLMTDGQIELPKLGELTNLLKAANARINVFAIGDGPGLPLLRKLAESTGGSFADQADAAQWASGLTKLLRLVTPQHWMTTPIDVRFNDLPPAIAQRWNRTWLKAGADELARSAGDDPTPMAARMHVGIGNVVAVAFRPPAEHVEALVRLAESPPRDPRLTVTWRTGSRMTVDLDTGTINGLSPTLVLSSMDGLVTGQTHPIPQTGPGRYRLSLPAPRESLLATVVASGRVIDRFAVAGRYAAEFDGIGNDRAALASLAARTGGQVIEPGDRGPLPLPRRSADAPLGPYFAIIGAALVAMGLVAWRVKA